MKDVKDAGIVIAITGASGVIYAVRLLQVLAHSGRTIHLTISPSGTVVIEQELGLKIDLRNFAVEDLLNYQPSWAATQQRPPLQFTEHALQQIHYYHYPGLYDAHRQRFVSDRWDDRLSVQRQHAQRDRPSGGANLIQRAAEVHLKEHRKLVRCLARRRSASCSWRTCTAWPPPAWSCCRRCPVGTTASSGLEDLVDFVVARILDQFELGEGLDAPLGKIG